MKTPGLVRAWLCDRGKRGRRGSDFGKASDARKNEVQVAPEILAKYVDTDVEQPPFWRTLPRVIEITLTDGRLFADMDDRGKVPLIASSEIRFAGLYGLGVEFIPGSPGGLFVQHVTGDYRFVRKVAARRVRVSARSDERASAVPNPRGRGAPSPRGRGRRRHLSRPDGRRRSE